MSHHLLGQDLLKQLLQLQDLPYEEVTELLMDCLFFTKKTPHAAGDLYSFLRQNSLQYVVLLVPPHNCSEQTFDQCSQIAQFCQNSANVVTLVVVKAPERAERFTKIPAKNFYVAAGTVLALRYRETHSVLIRPDAYISFLGDMDSSTAKFKEHLSSLIADL